ncbi:MAG: hypothetical protein HY726_09470 [Candidatus Rokubacteria bacterium]|nr:hypothetical protein [Candidatus Rokubacteria bacterium]
MDRFRWVALVLVVTTLLSGSPALLAWAQQPQQPSQEAPKAAEPAKPKESGDAAYAVGAAALTVINVPGRTVTCVIGSALGIVVMAITFGSGYRAATQIVEEGCRGPWILTADDLKGEPTTETRTESMGRY